MAVQGMKVMPGEKLFDVADFSHVWIVADIYEYELSTVRVGQPVKITSAIFRAARGHPDRLYLSHLFRGNANG